MVSVPCRGLFYFILSFDFTNSLANILFPSPAGVFFISSYFLRIQKNMALLCFRPLPGSFLFHRLTVFNIFFLSCVSVPCRGLFYFILSFDFTNSLANILFPSPAGVFFISSYFLRIQKNMALLCFRPLPGSFLFHRLTVFNIFFLSCVSVPCRGLFYFINKTG